MATGASRMLVIAVDFDGVLCRKDWPRIGAPMPGAFDFLDWLELKGFKKVLWTCREGPWLDEALAWLDLKGKYGREWWDGVNETPACMVYEAGFKTPPRKVFADLYIDDRAIMFPVLDHEKQDVDWDLVKECILS